MGLQGMRETPITPSCGTEWDGDGMSNEGGTWIRRCNRRDARSTGRGVLAARIGAAIVRLVDLGD